MVPRLQQFKSRLPDWVQDWLDFIVPSLQILLILLAAWVLQYLLRRLVRRASARYQLPSKLLAPLTGLIRWVVMGSALLLVLERLGVSATVLWTAFTGFATVGAVAFFAAWSVLSNLFCALLILTVRPFRVGDHIEVLDTAEKPGAKGQVVDINLLYTTLLDPLEGDFEPDGKTATRPVVTFNGVGGTATPQCRFVEGKYGKGLAFFR